MPGTTQTTNHFPPPVPSETWGMTLVGGSYPGGRMAWVNAILEHYGVRAELFEGSADITDCGNGSEQRVIFDPAYKEDAHSCAFILRKVAQHLERVGNSLPERGNHE